MSVSEVKRLYYREFLADSADIEQEKHDFATPRFLQPGKTDAAGKGIIVHTVLEHINLDKPAHSDVLALLDDLINKKLLTPDEAAIVPVDRVVRFLASDVVARMRRSPKMRREIPFAVSLPPGLINSSFAGEAQEEMVLHGVVDCAFEEDGGLVIVDYKTERLQNGAQSAAEAYRPQLELYQLALEKIFEMPVKQRIIYFFDSDIEISI